MDRKEILLKEYETYQQDISFHGSRYWTIVGIFIAVSTAMLGGLIYGLVSNGVLLKALQESALPQIFIVGLLTIIVGAGMITILVFLKCWIRRVNWLAYVSYFRMREIESKLGMAKNWIVDVIDNDWQNLSPIEQKRLTRLHKRHKAPKEVNYFMNILRVLIALWGVAIAGPLAAITIALVSRYC